jgi:hypothetical protein
VLRGGDDLAVGRVAPGDGVDGIDIRQMDLADGVGNPIESGGTINAVEGAGKLTGKDIQYSDKLSNSQWQKQITGRGWSNDSIANTINEPFTTRLATNRATGNAATAYYNQNGSYVIRDNTTGKVVQISDIASPSWIQDPSIVDPYMP